MAINFDARELELLIMALRYWRANRPEGQTRRNDPRVTLDTIDALLGKLGYAATAAAPPDDFTADFFAR
jgi:hypothetical protein